MTRPDPPDAVQGMTLIAVAIVVAGGLVAAGIVAAVLLRPPSQAGAQPTSPVVAYLPAPFRPTCAHSTDPDASQTKNVPGIQILYDESEITHACQGMSPAERVSYHRFKDAQAMEKAFIDALTAEGHVGHSATPCQDEISSGYGRYEFPDGRTGLAACLRDGEKIWIIWTEDSTKVVAAAYTTTTSQEGIDALAAFWKSGAGPTP